MILIPLGPERPSRRRPWATYGLIAACAAVFAAGLGLGEERILHAFAFVPADPSPLSWIAHLFTHGGLAHLAGNMLFLWVWGTSVEAALGRGVYVLLFLLLGVAASLVHGLCAGVPQIPLVGASGAISALMGIHTALFPRARLRIFYFLWWGWGGRSGVRAIPVWVCSLLWAAEQAFWMWGQAALGLGLSVAFMAHLGGFAAGLLAGLAWSRAAPGGPARAGILPTLEESARIRTLLDAARENLRNGYRDAAVRAVAEALRIDPSTELPEDLSPLRPGTA